MFFLAVHTPGFIPAHAGNTGRQALPSGRLQVHPRSRGEYACKRGRSWKPGGSSPLTRGILVKIYDDKGKQGFIPAHAGNTKFVFMWDGEKGFIPAHAGNTIFPWLHPQK